ncbi:MAG: 2-oxoacid:acceptor oxidoreductase subunit alpha [Deferribacterales bacterium]
MSSVYVWKIGGPAGFGIMTTGPMFAKVLKASGYHVHGYPEYPSLVRGGYNCYQIAFGDTEVTAPYKKIDMYVALSDECFNREKFEESTYVIGDFANLKNADGIKAKKIDVPLMGIVKELEGPDIMRNSVALGAAAALLGLDFSLLEKNLTAAYKEKVAKINIEAAKKGYESVKERYSVVCKPAPDKCAPALYVTGNEAVSIGAVAGGLTFFSTYPMTPASSILHYLAKCTREHGLVVKHTEDEIAGINMAVGAAFAGARAMTGTAGGGFSLMNEGLGLAAITEVPIVLAVSQRPGPATGMATWTEQGDLKYIINASQGEFIRAVYSPGSVEECYKFTFDALNLAEKYHIPVFVLLDKFLSESHFMAAKMPETGDVERGYLFEGNEEEPMAYFNRFAEKKDGVGVRVIPGTKGGLYIASSNEHTDEGFVSDKADVRKRQVERRYRKLQPLIDDMPHPELFGKKDAPLTFVCFGSVKMMLLEAMKHTDKFNFIHFPAVNPLNWEKVKKMLEGRNLCVMENNYTAQLRGIIAENTGIIIEKTFLKYDGRPFFNEEIVSFAEEAAK